jgi:hypothetical protein
VPRPQTARPRALGRDSLHRRRAPGRRQLLPRRDQLPDSESGTGFDILDEHFGGEGTGINGTIVFQAPKGVTDPEVEAQMQALFDHAAELADVKRVISPYSDEGSRQVATKGPEAGTIAYAEVELPEDIEFARAGEIRDEILDDAPDIEGLRIEMGGFIFAEFEEPSSEALGLAFAIRSRPCRVARRARSAHEALAPCNGHRRRTVAHAELPVEVARVGTNGLPGELHLVGRLLWAESIAQQRKQFGLPPGEPEVGTGPSADVDLANCHQRRLGCEVRRDYGFPGGQSLQGIDQFLGGYGLEDVPPYAHPQRLEQQAQVVSLGEHGHREWRLLDQHCHRRVDSGGSPSEGVDEHHVGVVLRIRRHHDLGLALGGADDDHVVAVRRQHRPQALDNDVVVVRQHHSHGTFGHRPSP